MLANAAERTGATFRMFGGLNPADLAAVVAGACDDYDLCSIGNVDYEVVARAAVATEPGLPIRSSTTRSW